MGQGEGSFGSQLTYLWCLRHSDPERFVYTKKKIYVLTIIDIIRVWQIFNGRVIWVSDDICVCIDVMVRSGLIDLLLVTCNPVLPASGSSSRRLYWHPQHFSQRRLWGGWLDTQMEVKTSSVKGHRFWRASGGHLEITTVALQLPFFGNGFRSKSGGKIQSWSP